MRCWFRHRGVGRRTSPQSAARQAREMRGAVRARGVGLGRGRGTAWSVGSLLFVAWPSGGSRVGRRGVGRMVARVSRCLSVRACRHDGCAV
eukprot:4068444-Pyramimonas_sp.AAC.1